MMADVCTATWEGAGPCILQGQHTVHDDGCGAKWSDNATPAAETMVYAARTAGWPGYVAVCADDSRFRDDTAREIARWIREGYVIERVTREQSVEGMREYSAERKRRKPPELVPAQPAERMPVAAASFGAFLAVTYLIEDAEGVIEPAGVVDCDACDGEGTVECSCFDCENEHERDCEKCDGTGKLQAHDVGADDLPILDDGETLIIAIVDSRHPTGKRIAYPDTASAEHALKALLELPDATLAAMFAERRAA